MRWNRMCVLHDTNPASHARATRPDNNIGSQNQFFVQISKVEKTATQYLTQNTNLGMKSSTRCLSGSTNLGMSQTPPTVMEIRRISRCLNATRTSLDKFEGLSRNRREKLSILSKTYSAVHSISEPNIGWSKIHHVFGHFPKIKIPNLSPNKHD